MNNSTAQVDERIKAENREPSPVLYEENTDDRIVSAAIYPPIGVCRVGNSHDEFFIGPEVPDPLPRERERHTLETLLASRLSDRAILLGKIGAAVGFEWVITQ